MSNQALLSERYVATFGWFVENGTTVDGQTITNLVKPDNVPPDNWPSMGDILPGFQFGVDTIDDSWMQAQPNGVFSKVPGEIVVGDNCTFTTRQQCELVHRLEFGTAAKLVANVAQSPHVASGRFILGWLHVQFRQLGGTDLASMDWWGQLRLGNALKRDEKAGTPEWKFTKLGSPGNSIVVLPA